jgi:L-lysine 2,3-aminomutase
MAFKDILRNSIRTFEDLEKWLRGQKVRVDPRLKDVIAKYPMRVNSYYLNLIEKMNDGIWRQAIPDVEELEHYMDFLPIPWMKKASNQRCSQRLSITSFSTEIAGLPSLQVDNFPK